MSARATYSGYPPGDSRQLLYSLMIISSASASSSVAYALVAISAIVLLKVFVALARQIQLKRQMPPGPRGLPWLGNAHQLAQFPWYRFQKWKQEYGILGFHDLTVTLKLCVS